MGLTVSDAVRLQLTRVAQEKTLPLVPNAGTIAAMEESRSSDLPRFDDAQSLFDDLHADDREDQSCYAHSRILATFRQSRTINSRTAGIA